MDSTIAKRHQRDAFELSRMAALLLCQPTAVRSPLRIEGQKIGHDIVRSILLMFATIKLTQDHCQLQRWCADRVQHWTTAFDFDQTSRCLVFVKKVGRGI
jgi:hypothetical protein